MLPPLFPSPPGLLVRAAVLAGAAGVTVASEGAPSLLAYGAGLFAAGLAGAWVGGAWWGSPAASLVAGVGWIAVCGDAVAAARPSWLAALALLPVAWGLFARALGDGRFVLAGAVAGAIAATNDAGVRWALLLFAPAVGAVVRERPRDGVSVALGTVGAAMVVAAGPLAWRGAAAEPAGLVQLPVALAIAGALGAWRMRALPRRIVLPGCLLLAGLGPVDAAPVAGLGLVLLAGGAVAGLQASRGKSAPSSPTSSSGAPVPNA